MQILSLELDNIKSYRQTHVDFAPGINAVCGHNGAGKTTILEAIGFALFDHLPYNQQDFLREGEKTGTVRVRLEALDGRVYEIVRKVGSSSQYYVADLETGTRLAERPANVQEWVRANALGIDGEADLSALFKNAIGVPQGLMTADFLGTTATRKAIFDPLLRVEEYEQAWARLRDTERYVKDRTGTVREEMARLSTDVERIPETLREADQLRGDLSREAEETARLREERDEYAAMRAALDTLAADLAAADNALRDRRYAAGLARNSREQAVDALEKAQAAGVVVTESEPNFHALARRQEELAGLESVRRERDEHRSAERQAADRLRSVQEMIDGLDAERAQAIAAGDTAKALATAAERQDGLEALIAEGVAARKDRRQLENDLATREAGITALRRRLTERDGEIAAARAAEPEAARRPEVEAALQTISAALGDMAVLEEQQRRLREEGVTLRAEHDRLAEQAQREREIREQIAREEPEASEADALRTRERDLQETLIRLKAGLEYQEIARAELSRAHCPLLDLTCPVVASGDDALQRFDARVSDDAARIAALADEHGAILPRLADADAAAARLARLGVELARVEGSEGQLPALAERLTECRSAYANLQSALDRKPQLESEKAGYEADLAAIRRAEQAVGAVPLLLQQAEQEARDLAEREAERTALTTRAEALDTAIAAGDGAQRELATLGDPRAERQRLLGIAGRLPDIEGRLATAQSRLQEEGDRLRALIGVLQRYQGLDEQIAACREAIESHRPGYERYLAHRDEAGRVAAREEALRQSEAALAAAEAATEAAREVHARLAEAYDADQHLVVIARHGDLAAAVARAEEREQHLQRRLADVEDDLAHYRRQEAKLVAQQAERDELERTGSHLRFIRETIKTAGPEVTRTLLANISQIANDIYAEIMDDHAIELRWDPDYEVMVRRGPEDRKFAQLSGGEQMSAALAVRLALLKEMSDVDLAFFDEPTQNMDADRRSNLAEQIRAVRGFRQLIVISHDDTFEDQTDHLIRLEKDTDETRVVA